MSCNDVDNQRRQQSNMIYTSFPARQTVRKFDVTLLIPDTSFAAYPFPSGTEPEV